MESSADGRETVDMVSAFPDQCRAINAVDKDCGLLKAGEARNYLELTV